MEKYKTYLNIDIKGKSIFFTGVFIFLTHFFAMSQKYGYWNNHVGIDLGGTYLKFNNPMILDPQGGQTRPGVAASIFFDFVRVKETVVKDVPVWGIKLKLNGQAVGFNGKENGQCYVALFTSPLLLKVRLFGSSSYYDLRIDNSDNKIYSRYNKKAKFDFYLFAGPQYNFIYSKSGFPYDFKNPVLTKGLYGCFSEVAGIELNFESVCFDVSYEKNLQPFYYNDLPINMSGFVLKFGIPFGNVYRHLR